MKIVCYKYNKEYGCGYIKENEIYSLFNGDFHSLNEFLVQCLIKNTTDLSILKHAPLTSSYKLNIDDVEIIAPLPRPNSFRDAYAFRQHVEAGRKNRGLDMIPEYDQIPVFYFSNHNSITGPGTVNIYEKHMDKLDFELEIAIIIGSEGINIKASDADQYIFGYTIMNDWSARSLQMQEMKLNLGPAKGKDFATSIGPCITTTDTMNEYKISSEKFAKHDIPLTASVNGIKVSEDNLKNMTWSFSEIIERASYGTSLFPGDIIGSGTCGTGCFLELNGSKNQKQWLQDGDIVEIDAGILGKLSNQIKLIK